MLGLIRLRIDADAPRARVERLEAFGGVRFQTAVLQVRRVDGALDRLMIRQSIRLLALRGVSKASAPDEPYIKSVLERYHIEDIGHAVLQRAMAPQVMEHILHPVSDGAVLLYARRLDADVLAAARYAAQHYRTLVLDFGTHGEMVRRRLLDECGTAALMEQVSLSASKTAALFFDKPYPNFRLRMPKPVSVALGSGAEADFNDMIVKSPLYEPLGDTDREAVFNALVAHKPTFAQGLELINLIKR